MLRPPARRRWPGYVILTPLRLTDGGIVIVNRGFAPAELKEPAKRAAGQTAGEVTLSGLMRRPETRNSFTPPTSRIKTSGSHATPPRWRRIGVCVT